MQQIRLKDVSKMLFRRFHAGHNVVLYGEPALGKTETIMAFAEKMRQKGFANFKVWTFYGVTKSPIDLQASMPNAETHKLEVYHTNLLPNRFEDPDACGIVFWGEMGNTDPMTAKTMQKYVNNEVFDGMQKPEKVICVMDTNRLEDKSGVMSQSRALLSRAVPYEAYVEAEDNIEHAAHEGFHPLIQAFMKRNPDHINNYRTVFATTSQSGKNSHSAEEGKAGVWANMRSWRRVSQMLYLDSTIGDPTPDRDILADLGTAVGTMFVTFRQMVDKLDTLEDVVKDPKKAKVPTAMDEQYAMVLMTALRFKEEHFKEVSIYIQRYDYDLQILFLKCMLGRKNLGNVKSSPEYQAWMSNSQITALLSA